MKTASKLTEYFIVCFLIFTLSIFCERTPKIVNPEPQYQEFQPEPFDPNEIPLLEKKVFELVNKYRDSKGIETLSWSVTIAKQCRSHSHDMAIGKFPFGHAGFQERLSTISRTFNISQASENIYHQYTLKNLAENAVSNWLNDPDGQEKITGEYDKSGVGIVKYKDWIYITQIFINTKLLSDK